MGSDQTSKYCKRCGKHVLAVRKSANHILHLLLTVFTAGLWLIMWFLLAVRVGGWRCSFCGKKV